MRSSSVACGMASQIQSPMLSATQSFQPITSPVIRVYENAGNVIETHEHAGEFKEP